MQTKPETTEERVMDGLLAARIERAVRDVFEKRFAGRTLPYEQARELVWLEQSLREHIVWSLSEPVMQGGADVEPA